MLSNDGNSASESTPLAPIESKAADASVYAVNALTTFIILSKGTAPDGSPGRCMLYVRTSVACVINMSRIRS